MLGACRQTCVRAGRSQGKTRALRGQKEERKGRGPRQEIIHPWWWWVRWEGRRRCRWGQDAARQGQDLICWAMSTTSGSWVPANSFIPPDPRLPFPRSSLAGNCMVLGHQWGYRKKQINSQGVFPLLGKGRDCVSGAVSRILQINCAIAGNLYKVKRSRKNLSVWVHATLKHPEL